MNASTPTAPGPQVPRPVRRELPALRYIAGHEDLDTTREPASDDPGVLVPRKMDPGPLFPWDAVLRTTPLERLLP